MLSSGSCLTWEDWWRSTEESRAISRSGRWGDDSDKRRLGGGRSSREEEARWLDHGSVDEEESVWPESGEAVEEREGCV